MPFTGDTFTHLFDWEKEPQRQEKIVNSRLEAEFDGIDTGISSRAAGAASSTDNAVARFDGTGGKMLQNSGVLVDDSSNMTPATNDVGALGTTSLQWADLRLADGGIVNWANSSARIIHSSAASARRLTIDAATTNDHITLGITGNHTFSAANTGYGVLNQLGATFNAGSGGAAWLQNYSQNLIEVQSSVTVGASWTFMVQNGTKGPSPTGTVNDQVCFYVQQPTAQHSGTASMTISSNVGLRIDNQGAYVPSAGINVTNAYALYIGAQTGATVNYGIYCLADVGVAGSLGYSIAGQGAGGTVAQSTSKSTGVTLNTYTGQITMNGAALAANTTVSFTLTNNKIAANDLLILNHKSGGTGGSYLLNPQCAAGSATINVRNVTAGSLSEAIVIAFTLIKGTTS
jgi:hypothetical protein